MATQLVKVLDVGCGDGVHWRYLRRLGNERLSYTGVDISATVIQRLQQTEDERQDKFIQMDVTALAGPDETYDLVFAFGVVAYTNDPAHCFDELYRVCKPGGWIGVWIYPQQTGLGGFVFSATRWLCQQAGPFWSRRIADLIVPFLGILPTRSKMNLRNSTWRQCREVILVNIMPKQLTFFQRDEVADWFMTHNVDLRFEDPDNPITIWGCK